MIVPHTASVSHAVFITAADFLIFLAHPKRLRAARRCKNGVYAVIVQAVDYLLKPVKIIYALLRLQFRPRENAQRYNIDVRAFHHLDITFYDFGAIEPLVGVIVAAV